MLGNLNRTMLRHYGHGRFGFDSFARTLRLWHCYETLSSAFIKTFPTIFRDSSHMNYKRQRFVVAFLVIYGPFNTFKVIVSILIIVRRKYTMFAIKILWTFISTTLARILYVILFSALLCLWAWNTQEIILSIVWLICHPHSQLLWF